MLSLSTAARPSNAAIQHASNVLRQVRFVSDSPYGRTHVWKKRQRVLPKPFVPQFPQLVVRADGSTYTHITTSPRSVIRLERDPTNNPLWSAQVIRADLEQEGKMVGRLGRFNRRFEGIGGHGENIDWMSGAGEGLGAEEAPLTGSKQNERPKGKKK